MRRSTAAACTGYIADIGNAQEVTFTTSGGLGEAEVGGPLMNIVPRTGGNTVKGSFYTSIANDALQGSNYTQALKDAGLSVPAVLLKLWDVNGSVGGPISQNRLWYFANVRARRERQLRAGHVSPTSTPATRPRGPMCRT